jgi:hypothetical protein
MASSPTFAKPRQTRPGLAPFLVSPFITIFLDGDKRYSGFVLARRGDKVLYAAADSRRFGVAIFDETTRQTSGARQFPEFDLAVDVFLQDYDPRH